MVLALLYIASMTQDFLTIREAATFLGVTPATLRNWDRKGRLTTRRHPMNNYRVYAVSDLREIQKQLSLFPPATSEDCARPSQPKDGPTSLRRLLAGLHRIARDQDGDSSIIDRFDEITKIVYMKIVDERTGCVSTTSPFRVGLEPGTCAQRLREMYARCVHDTPSYFPDRFASIRLSDGALAAMAQHLAGCRLSGKGTDMAGTAYEDMICDTFDKQDNQQFFTPHPIVEFMASLAGSTAPRVICDPACGTGGFLAAAGRLFRDRKVRPRLLGLEIDERLAWATRLNLDIHGLGDFTVAALAGSGSLAPTVTAEYGGVDWILTNPPFGSDLTDAVALSALQLGRGRASRRRGALFIERCLDLLRANGRVAIVIDDGVLNGPSNIDVREHVLSRAHVEAVFSLPEVAFMPYATVKSSILLLRKRGRAQSESPARNARTFFAHVEAVGRRPNGDPAYRVKPDSGTLELDNDLPQCAATYEAWTAGRSLSAPTGLRAFASEIPSPQDPHFLKDGLRLDLAYHDPARTQSLSALGKSKHPLRKLADLCDLRREPAVPAQDFPDDEIVYVGLANIEATTGRCEPTIVRGATLKSAVLRALPGDILFAKMRPELRKVWRVPSHHGSVYASPECLVLRARDGAIDPDLLALILRTDLVFGQLVHQVIGIGRPRISLGSMLDISIPVPPAGRQRLILSAFRRRESGYLELSKKGTEMLDESKRLRDVAITKIGGDLIAAEAGDD